MSQLSDKSSVKLPVMDPADDLYATQSTFGTALHGDGLAVPKIRFYRYLTFLS